MASWHSSNLGDPMLASAGIEAIRAAFFARVAGETPAGAAVFLRHESHGDLHCDLVAYFNPAAAEIARALGATVCAPPAASGLERFAGDG